MANGEFDKWRWVIVANVKSDRVFRKGAKVTLLYWHGDFANVKVCGLSKAGRRVFKYIAFKKLNNFRPNVQPRYLGGHVKDRLMETFGSKDEALDLSRILCGAFGGIQQFDHEGVLVEPGVTAREAYESYARKLPQEDS